MGKDKAVRVDLESWFDRYRDHCPSVLLGADGFPGGERSLLLHDPIQERVLEAGDVDGLSGALASTRGGEGVWVGYLSYDFALPFVKERSCRPPVVSGWPAALLRYYPTAVWRATEQLRRSPRAPLPLDFVADDADAIHRDRIKALLPRLVLGDLYQANLTRAFRAAPVDGIDLFLSLATHSPAPYAAYLQTPSGELVCNSPEQFLSWSAGGELKTSPIKGTRPRGRNAVEDQQQREALLADPKERAEHLMVVDLLRNDLGRVSQPGSVRCQKLFEAVAFPEVWHLVTQVVSQVTPDLDRAQILSQLLPGGSITGAPKRAACQWIERLERRARGPYCGNVVAAFDDGSLEANIIIRSALCQAEETVVQTGGGIVLDSDPARECEETWLKLSSFTL